MEENTGRGESERDPRDPSWRWTDEEIAQAIGDRPHVIRLSPERAQELLQAMSGAPSGRRMACTTGYTLTLLGGMGMVAFWYSGAEGLVPFVFCNLAFAYMVFLGFLVAITRDVDESNGEE